MEAESDFREGASALLAVIFQVPIALGAFLGGQIVDRLELNSAMCFGAIAGILGLSALLLGRGADRTRF